MRLIICFSVLILSVVAQVRAEDKGLDTHFVKPHLHKRWQQFMKRWMDKQKQHYEAVRKKTIRLLPLKIPEKTAENKEAAQMFVEKQDSLAIQVGAQRMDLYVPLLRHKRIAVMANQTSVVPGESGEWVHLIDTLRRLDIQIVKIFTPEHGFEGRLDAGEKFASSIDKNTGIPIISLYGKHIQPTREDLQDVDMVVYDIQDVGVRFYTYIASFQHLLEACWEQGIPLLVLDRPNPNGFYVDGPVLERAYASLVGRQPVPVVYGMTIGEYAQMLAGEPYWLSYKTPALSEQQKIQLLKIIPCAHYTHTDRYELPIPPSPNLPNMQAVYLYPSLCFFEATNVSVGRGTSFPFQCYGSPHWDRLLFSFSPVSVRGAKNPLHQNKICYGYDLRRFKRSRHRSYFTLSFLLKAFHKEDRLGSDTSFFTLPAFFHKLSGSDKLYRAIVAGKKEAEIRKEWQPALRNFKTIRKKYLLYKDFE